MSARWLMANLDAEYVLRGSSTIPKPARAQRLRWSTVLRLMPGWERAEALGEDDRGQAPGELLPWCWDERAQAIARRLGHRGPFPTAEAVGLANDKRFSAQIEDRAEKRPAGCTELRSLADLDAPWPETPWLLKHPFGVAGRDQMPGAGQPDTRTRRWAERILATSTLLREPRLTLHKQWSLQYHLRADGSLERLGALELISDRRGQFAGHLQGPGVGEDAPLDEAATMIAGPLHAIGYFGPVGVDAFAGPWGRRPLVEINARLTFGRLAWELARRLPEDRYCLWLHLPSSRRRDLGDLDELRDGERASGIYRLDERRDPGARSGTAVVLSEERPEPDAYLATTFGPQ